MMRKYRRKNIDRWGKDIHIGDKVIFISPSLGYDERPALSPGIVDRLEDDNGCFAIKPYGPDTVLFLVKYDQIMSVGEERK
jgi:hypothetical protein